MVLLPLRMAADYYGVRSSEMLRMIDRGDVRAYRDGRRILVEVSDDDGTAGQPAALTPSGR